MEINKSNQVSGGTGDLATTIRAITPSEDAMITEGILSNFPRDFPHGGASLHGPNLYESCSSEAEERQLISDFFSEAQKLARWEADDLVYVVWDDPSEPSLEIRVGELVDVFPQLLRHTTIYVVSVDYSWCIALTTFGDLGFGFSTSA